MGRGLITGFVWGAIVAILVLGTATLFAPAPVRESRAPAQDRLELPAGTEFEAERPETEPRLPAAESATPEPGVSKPPLPRDERQSPPAADTRPGSQPEVAAGPGPDEPTAPTAEIAAPAPPAAEEAGPEPGAGASVTPPGGETPPETPPAPAPVESPAQPEAATAEAAPEAPAAEDDVRTDGARAIGVPLPRIDSPLPEGGAPEPTPEVEIDTEERGRLRLPQITAPQITAPDADGAAGEEMALADAGEADAAAEDGAGAAEAPRLGGLNRNAVPFEGAEGRPLMSIVLIDAGDEGLDPSVLTTFSFPVTFAVDPSQPDALDRARLYRAAGFEVLVKAPVGDAGLQPGMQPADVERALESYFSILPQSVGIMDRAGEGFQKTGPLADQVIAYLSDSGHGLLTYEIGLNATNRKALRAGVPAATVFRPLDDDKERAIVIGRYLDRAAFRARNDGYVVMAGHSYPETVKALFAWAMEDEARSVVMAPVSAVMRLAD